MLTNVPNQVNLSIAAAGQRIQFWDGADQTGNGVVNGGTGTWNATNTNWTGAPGQAGINDQWRSSVGVFAGTAGTVTVAGAQAFDTLQFSTTGYVLNAGAGGQLQLAGLSGTGTLNTDSGVVATINTPMVNGSSQGLTKVGGGTLVLGGANTYTGATTISGGTLTIAAGGSITSDIINNATFNNSGTVSGNLFNTGAINNSLTITGAVSNAGTFNNNANGTVSGLMTTAGGITTNTGQLNGGASVIGGTLVNNNLVSGLVAISLGRADNNLTIAGAVSNSGIFNNNANGTVFGLLTNAAGTTTNAGQLNGGVVVNDGMLTTTGTILNGLTNRAIVNANGGAINGAIVNGAGGTFSVGGTVTGDSAFTNIASATLAIGASGVYTLQGMLTNSGAVTVVSGGQLIAAVGGITNTANGSITVALGGTVKDNLNNAGIVTNNGVYVANVATNTGVVANQTGGTWTGNLLSNAGTVTNQSGGTWSGNAANSPGGTFNNLGTWTGTVSNAGTFNNDVGATVSGLLTNTAGITTNNGALNGGAVVSGGMLVGAGTVTNLTIANGATFAPGNGMPGSSMMVAGNLAFQSGALYLVQLNPATSSSTSVIGTATPGGATVNAVYANGSYVSKQYTILNAAGGVSGTFSSLVNTNLPGGFHTTLGYDANDAYLNLALNFIPPPGSGLNANQQSVANAIVGFFNTTGTIPLVFGGLTPAGLTQISGEVATGTQQTTFDAMGLFMGLLTDPFIAGRGDPVMSSSTAPQFADDESANAYASNGKARTKSERDAYAAVYRKAPVMADPFTQRWSVWAAGYGGSQTTDGNAVLGSNNTRSSIGGVAVGADYLFSPRTIAGFALAGGGINFSVNGLGTGRSDLFQAGAFVRHSNGPAYVSAALAYGWQDITTDRTVTVAGADLLRARFNANAFSGRVEGGYRFVTPWMAMGITPYAAGQFTTFDLPAYSEQAIAGANTFALGYTAKSVTASRSEFGLRSDKSFAMQDGIFTLRGRAAWAHNFNPDRNIAATFQTLPGASFVVNGAAQARDAALVTASAEMKWLNGFSLAGTFEGEFSNVTTSYAGKGVVRYAW